MTAGITRSIPMKRNHEAYATCERHDDAKPGINANKTADGVDNVVDSPIFNMCLIVSNRVEGLTNPAGAGSDEDTSSLDAGAEKPGPNPLPPTVEPPVLNEEANIATNSRSKHNATTDLLNLEAVAAFKIWETTTMASNSVENSSAGVAPPSSLAASDSPRSDHSNENDSILSINGYGAVLTISDHSSSDESSTTSPLNRAAGVPSNPRAIYQQVANNLKPITPAQMDEPLEGPEGFQFDEYVKILREQKTADLALYKMTNNHCIVQLDWAARDKEFNRAFIWGDCVFGAKLNNLKYTPRLPSAKLHRTFIDIEIKRIAGSDRETLEACGVHPHFAFMGLLGCKGNSDDGGPTADSRPSTASGSASTVTDLTSSGPGAWPVERTTATPEPVASSSSAAAGIATPSGPGAWPSSPAGPSSVASRSSSTIPTAYSSTRDFHINVTTTLIPTPQGGATAATRARMYDLVEASPVYADLKAKAAIYLVRVIAIPNPPFWSSTETNQFYGPHSRDATLCGLGGWVVPNTSACRSNKSQHFSGLRSAPIDQDWTFSAPAAVEGDYVPIWEGAEEPTLEDVYHMVWDLVADRQFVGLVSGHGFGRRRESGGYPFEKLRAENPFQSPSREE